MKKNRSQEGHPLLTKRRALLKLFICYVIISLLSLAIILGVRGIMNVWNRMDYILKRLDDYPQLYDSYQKEIEGWDDWCINEGLGIRAKEAAVLYRYLNSPKDESEKLEYIKNLLDAEEARIISEAPHETLDDGYSVDEASHSITFTSPVEYGRSILLRFSYNLKEARFSSSEITDFFIRRVEAGLPGHVMIVHDGALSVYPKDSEGAALKQVVGGMLARGELNPDEQRQEAEKNEKTSSVFWKFNVSDPMLPKDGYILYCSAYTENADYVIGAVPTSEMLRLAGHRSWSLWFLFLSLMLLLGVFLWRIACQTSGLAAGPRGRSAKNRLWLAVALILLTFSVLYTQQMSAVSQSEQAAIEEATFLKYMLKDEEARRDHILEDYDFLHSDQAVGIASLLSDHPELEDPYILYQLDVALGASGLQITDLEGNPIVSDRAIFPTQTPGAETGSKDSSAERVYQAAMENQQGRADRIVKLYTPQQEVENLLKETEPGDVIGELTLLDTLHVVAVDRDHRDVIIASTNESWIGDNPREHGVDTEPFYDGYEGLINFDGQNCYSIVFQHQNILVAVGSESISILVFLGGILVLLIPLALLLTIGIYRPVIKTAGVCQSRLPQASPDEEDTILPGSGDKNLNPLRLVHGYMVAFFINTVLLYVGTNGNSSGLTYNLVRGTWRRGVNAVTVTTAIILASMVFTIHLALELLLRHLAKYLSQRGKTIANLLINAAGYVCAIVVILYTLSMFGMNTATLVGGVGAAALVFTLGANSLISDVLSGLFIIFDSDYVIGDKVEINGFIGIVTDISIRNTSLESLGSHEVKIIRNSLIKELVNRSKHAITNYIEFQIGRKVTLEEAQERICSVLKGLDKKYPQLIGEPFFGGVSALPQLKPPGIPLEQCTVCIGFRCLDKDSVFLEYAIREELLDTVNDLLFSS